MLGRIVCWRNAVNMRTCKRDREWTGKQQGPVEKGTPKQSENNPPKAVSHEDCSSYYCYVTNYSKT